AILGAFVALLGTTAPLASPVATRPVVVRGLVTDVMGNAIDAASVDVAGTTYHASTNSAGEYVLPLQTEIADSVTVRVRRIGYEIAARRVALTGDTVRADFRLVQSMSMLQEVVVTSAAAQYGSAAGNGAIMLRGPSSSDPLPRDRERYARIVDNAFLSAASEPLSTFSVDVDRASYANVRRFVNRRQLPPKDAVRIEELVNYFPYDYADPSSEHPIVVRSGVAAAPWNSSHRVVRIGLQTKRVAAERVPPSNLVFLLDVSGSMNAANKLPLVKQSINLLIDRLREEDRVALVVYAGAAGLVLPSTPGSDKEVIRAAVNRLEAGGSTAGGAGIRLAYEVAKQNFIKGGNNRVILATDGDFNVGISDDGGLTRLIESRREEGTYLTVLGFGYDNLNDQMMEQLADKGNGNYAYIDDLSEAKKVFGTELTSTIYTVAKDVKLQVEFNPSVVQAYRLIGYEDRKLANEDFNNDKKDAGDMGAGHSVTALYEIIPVGVKADVEIEGTKGKLRYQRVAEIPRNSRRDELMYVNVRYKQPDERKSRLLQQPVRNEITRADSDFSFALAVATYGMLLRESPYRGDATMDRVLSLARDGLGRDEDGYRAGFLQLVDRTKELEPLRVGRVP
ncbi:MAG TPA: von Willebrand factor type A domain-containing protein, partial [Gemmatimonadaceae bacterium]